MLFDGTFWTDDELIALGIGERTAREMDHLPIAGAGGSLERLAALPCRHRIYTHINNTNPILLEHSPERASVTRTGVDCRLRRPAPRSFPLSRSYDDLACLRAVGASAARHSGAHAAAGAGRPRERARARSARPTTRTIPFIR